MKGYYSTTLKVFCTGYIVLLVRVIVIYNYLICPSLRFGKYVSCFTLNSPKLNKIQRHVICLKHHHL